MCLTHEIYKIHIFIQHTFVTLNSNSHLQVGEKIKNEWMCAIEEVFYIIVGTATQI